MISVPTRRGFIAGLSAAAVLLPRNLSVPTISTAAAATNIFRRRDVNELKPDDTIIKAYRKAVTEMMRLDNEEPENPLGWLKQAKIHRNFCPHGNWFFVPWHRAYLHYFEDICRKLSGVEEFALPYWNWTRNPQIPAAFWGEGNPLNRLGRIATPESIVREELVRTQVIDEIMGMPDFEGFGSGRSSLPRGGSGGGATTLEGTPHNGIHSFVGGDMVTYMSPLDPIFWLHHCNIDRIWASWNNIKRNTNPSDSAFAGFVLKGTFVDRSGTAVDVKISDMYDISPLGYEYDRLEPEPPDRIGGVLRQDMVLKSVDTFEQPISKSTEAGVALAMNVDVSSKRLSNFEVALADIAVEGEDTKMAAMPPLKAEVVRLRISGIRPPADPRAFVRVFLNCPYLTVDTPINDPHYVASFAFFTDEHGMGGMNMEGLRYEFDITETLDALRRADLFPEAAIQPQLLAFGGDGEPKGVVLDGKFEIEFFSAVRKG